MLDPFSAISLTANIVQFVEFGIKLLSESQEIYSSTKGSSLEHVDLENIYDKLQSLSDRLYHDQSTMKRRPGEEQQLRELAGGCKVVVTELISTVQDLRVKGDNNRRWRSFCQALKTIRRKGEINSLRQRLDRFSVQLTLHLAALSWFAQRDFLKTLVFPLVVRTFSQNNKCNGISKLNAN